MLKGVQHPPHPRIFIIICACVHSKQERHVAAPSPLNTLRSIYSSKQLICDWYASTFCARARSNVSVTPRPVSKSEGAVSYARVRRRCHARVSRAKTPTQVPQRQSFARVIIRWALVTDAVVSRQHRTTDTLQCPLNK